MNWLSGLLRDAESAWSAANETLAPYAVALTDFRQAPIYILGTVVLSILGWIANKIRNHFRRRAEAREKAALAAEQAEKEARAEQRRREDEERQRALDAKVEAGFARIEAVMKISDAALLDAITDRNSMNVSADDARAQLRTALGNFLASSDPRGEEVLRLVEAKNVDEAARVSMDMANDAQEALASIESAAAAARDKAVQNWRDAGAIAFLSNTKAAIAAYERVVALKPDDADALLSLGDLYVRTGQLDAAEAKFAAVLARPGEEVTDKYVRAAALGGRGAIAYTRGDYPAADRCYREANKAFEDIAAYDRQAYELINVANIQRILGAFDVADEFVTRALAYFEQINQDEGLAAAFITRGAIAMDAERLDEAETLNTRAAELYRKLGGREGAANATMNLGVIAWRKNDLDRADRFYREALALYTELEAKESEGLTLVNIAEIILERGQTEEAYSLLEKAAALLQEIGSVEAQYYTFALYGRVEWRRGAHDAALQRWSGLLENARKASAKVIINEILRIVAREGVSEAQLNPQT